MPRNGSGTYTQPFPDVVEGTTIESAVYNAFTNDVAIDLNAPRPILAGGTGAASADEALDNLKAEKFKQIVTSWDTTVWRAGSFYAATTAIGVAPVTGHAFAGVVYYANATDFVIEATDLTDPASPDQYIRIMTAGVWGAWVRLNPNVSSANLGEYNFNNQVTFPPGSGQIRFNNATQNSTTEVFISHLSATGVDNSSQITAYLLSGVDFIVQDKDEGNKYKVFTTTAAVVLSGGDFRVTATLKIAGIDLVSAQRMTVTASSEAQRVQQRQLIYAAPFDALAYNGMQINGSMDVHQSGSGEVATSGLYHADGWVLRFTGTMAVRLGRSNTVVGGGSFSRFTYYLYYYATAAQTSLGASDNVYILHYVEGYRSDRLRWGTANAQPLTIGFWSNHDIPGTYSVCIRNSATNRSCAINYTHNTATVEQYNVLTFPGCTDGVWDVTNGAGLSISFAVAAGTSVAAPSAGGWLTGNYIAGPGQVNAVAATDKFFRITGVVVLPGIEAPTAAQSPLIMRPYDQEIITCQRYYNRAQIDFIGYAAAGNFLGWWMPHAPYMRAAPTATLAPGGTLTNCTTPNLDTITDKGCRFTIQVIATGMGTAVGQIKVTDARL